MSEQRRKCASVCLKSEALGTRKIEIFPAALWGGPDGLYRVRQDGRWRDGTRGAWGFHSPLELAEMLVSELFGVNPRGEDTPPDMPHGTRIGVTTPEGLIAAWADTEKPFRGFDGRWYVGCHMAPRGVVMVPCDDVRIVRRKRQGE